MRGRAAPPHPEIYRVPPLPGFEPDQHWWKASALTPLRHWPCSPKSSR